MTWEKFGTFKLDMGGETATAAWRGPGRRMAACWVLLSLPGRPTPSSFTAAALGPAHARGEARNRAANGGWKWKGGPTTGAYEPHGSSPGWQLLPHCSWGPAWDWKGSTYMETRHQAANGWPKVNVSHKTGVCWAPWAVHRYRWLHCTCHL